MSLLAATQQSQRGELILRKLSQARKLQKKKNIVNKHKYNWEEINIKLHNEQKSIESDISDILRNAFTRPQQRSRSILDEAKRVLRQNANQSQNEKNDIEQEIEFVRGVRKALKEDLSAQVLGIRELLSLEQRDPVELGTLLMMTRNNFNQNEETLHAELCDTLAEVHRYKRLVTQPEQAEECTTKNFEDLLAGNEYPSVVTCVESARKSLVELEAAFQKNNYEIVQAIESHKQDKLAMQQKGDWLGDLFVTVVKQSRSKGVACIMEQAQLHFPKTDRSIFITNLNWIDEKHKLKTVLAELKASQRREISMQKSIFSVEITKNIQAAVEEQCKLAYVEELDIKREELHTVLAAQRVQRDLNTNKARIHQEMVDRLKMEDKERQLEMDQMERERKHALIDQVHRQRAFEKAVSELEAAQHEEMNRQQRQEEAPYHQGRMKYRATQMAMKEMEEKIKLMNEEEDQRRKDIALDTIRKSVPYYNKLQEIVPDPKKATFSSKAVLDTYKNYGKQGLFKTTGFTDDKVCGDVRFKIINALQSKGLASSSYASTLLRSMNNSMLTNKNLHTTI